MVRHPVVFVAISLIACGLSGCGTINGFLASSTSDYVPQWLGGMPADAPPRPGTAKYEEYMRERERKRLEPATATGETAKEAARSNATGKSEAAGSEAATSSVSASSLDPVH